MTFDDFVAVPTFRVESRVVAVLAKVRAISLDEGFTAERDVTRGASETLRVEGFLLGHYERRVNATTTFDTNLRITTTHTRGGFSPTTSARS